MILGKLKIKINDRIKKTVPAQDKKPPATSEQRRKVT